MKYWQQNNILNKIPIISAVVITIMFLTGCNDIILMHPQGAIGLQERSLTLITIILMLTIVIPAIVMTIFFAIKYRSSNMQHIYNLNLTHTRKIEIIIWGVPVIIILILAILTWDSTHKLDPQKPIISNINPITIQVIALDWKWLFIYPKEGIATINEIVFPKNTPLNFNITSNSVMNSFFIPQLGSQIYAMAGMKTTLHLIANRSGIYKGISSNFSGHGFSGMKFTATATNTITEFNQWIQKVQSSQNTLDSLKKYEKIAYPTEFHPVEYFSNVKNDLFYDVINKFILNK